jgi:hypothetical protein
MTDITDEMVEAGISAVVALGCGPDSCDLECSCREFDDEEDKADFQRMVRTALEGALSGRAVVDQPAPSGDVDVLATKYDVSVLPRDDINRSAWSITVEYRGNDKYAVLIRGHLCLSRDGTSEIEPVRDDRTDEWLAEHRFSLDEALRLAVEHAPNVRCNGKNAVELLEWLSERDAAGVAGGDTR